MCQAWIEYNSNSKKLSVSFTGFQNHVFARQDELEYTIDLRVVLPERVIFGFSAATGNWFETNNVKSWIFFSSDIDQNKMLLPTSSLNPAKGKNTTGLLVGLLAGLSVLVTFFAILTYVLWRKKKNNILTLRKNNEIELGATGPRRFSYLELARATSGLADDKKLGQGGFGGVYKGFLKDLNIYVAVKRVSKTLKQGIKEYASEVRIISRLRHRNLVQLTGWCHEKEELFASL